MRYFLKFSKPNESNIIKLEVYKETYDSLHWFYSSYAVGSEHYKFVDFDELPDDLKNLFPI